MKLDNIRNEHDLEILGYDCECRLTDIEVEPEDYDYERYWVWKHKETSKQIVIYDLGNTYCRYDNKLTNLINIKQTKSAN